MRLKYIDYRDQHPKLFCKIFCQKMQAMVLSLELQHRIIVSPKLVAFTVRRKNYRNFTNSNYFKGNVKCCSTVLEKKFAISMYVSPRGKKTGVNFEL